MISIKDTKKGFLLLFTAKQIERLIPNHTLISHVDYSSYQFYILMEIRVNLKPS